MIIRSLWPWRPKPPTVPLPLTGDVTSAAALLGVSEQTLADASQLLCADLRSNAATGAVWAQDGDGFALMMDTPDVRMMQTFGHDESGRLYVEFKLLALETTLQNRALTRTALRNAAIVYDFLKVDYCIAYANFDVGGYAWAKLGAMADAPETCRTDLTKRLADKATTYSREEYDHLARLIADASPQTLMFDLACATLDGETALGKPLLMGYMWSAIWQVADSSQRARIAGALS